MATPLISIIVPIYNTESYLEQCMESLLHQTLHEVEIICINDGSTDGSEQILQRYASQDNRIILVSQEHMGVIKARNEALKRAKGIYVGFVDSDDYIDPRMYEEMLKCANGEIADIVECGAHVIAPHVPREDAWWFHRYLEPKHTNSDDLSASTWGDKFASEEIRLYIWNKIFRREFLVRHNIVFREGHSIGEDMVFVVNCLSCCRAYRSCDSNLYYYRLGREGSASSPQSADKTQHYMINADNAESTVIELLERNDTPLTRENLVSWVTWLVGNDIYEARGYVRWLLLERLVKLYRQLGVYALGDVLPDHLRELRTALLSIGKKHSYRSFLLRLHIRHVKYTILHYVMHKERSRKCLEKSAQVQTELQKWTSVPVIL